MRILVHAKTQARKEGVERKTQPSLGLTSAPGEKVIYKVSVKEAPVDGKANDAIARMLAGHFGVSFSCVHLVSGHSFKQKVFDIDID